MEAPISRLLERLRQATSPGLEIDRELGSGAMGVVFLGRDVARIARRLEAKVNALPPQPFGGTMNRIALLLLGALVSQGCYHATIETGKPASPETIDQQWASSFVFGLVPPNTVETAKKCPNGVSKVETQHTFLNGVVQILTFGIYTPIAIKVTCAARSSADAGAVIRASENGETAAQLMQRAAELSRELNAPVMVDFQ